MPFGPGAEEFRHERSTFLKSSNECGAEEMLNSGEGGKLFFSSSSSSSQRRLFHYQVVPNSLSWPCQQTLAVHNPPALQLSYGYSD